MSGKVFLSHQSADTSTAAVIASRLRDRHGITCYLDVIDPHLNKPGEDLAAHIRAQMGTCSRLLAVVSDATRASQWVPWEIGVATEKEFPLGTFSAEGTPPPEFLQKWPYLRTLADLDRYAAASRAADLAFTQRRAILNESARAAQTTSTREFYKVLRASLGQ